MLSHVCFQNISLHVLLIHETLILIKLWIKWSLFKNSLAQVKLVFPETLKIVLQENIVSQFVMK